MSDVTRILSQIESGDPSAAEQLLPLVYDELRKLAAAKLAQEKPGQTLQATALVHEAYLRLVDVGEGPALGQSRPFLCGSGRGDAADPGGKRPRQGPSQTRRRRGQASDLEELDVVGAARGRAARDLDEAMLNLGTKIPRRRTGQASILCWTVPRPGRRGTRHFVRNCLSTLGLCQGVAAHATLRVDQTLDRLFAENLRRVMARFACRLSHRFAQARGSGR